MSHRQVIDTQNYLAAYQRQTLTAVVIAAHLTPPAACIGPTQTNTRPWSDCHGVNAASPADPTHPADRCPPSICGTRARLNSAARSPAATREDFVRTITHTLMAWAAALPPDVRTPADHAHVHSPLTLAAAWVGLLPLVTLCALIFVATIVAFTDRLRARRARTPRVVLAARHLEGRAAGQAETRTGRPVSRCGRGRPMLCSPEVLRRVVDLRGRRLTYQTIADLLNTEQIPTPPGPVRTCFGSSTPPQVISVRCRSAPSQRCQES